MQESQTNPYQSPSVDRPYAAEEDQASMASAGLLARAIFGLWAGVLFGGTFGAGASVVLGLADAAVLGLNGVGPGTTSVEQFVLTEIVAAIAGAICGLASGAMIGPLVALVTGLNACRNPRPVMFLAIVLSTLAGGLLGSIGGNVLAAAGSMSWLAAGLGMAIGGISGVLGGFQLGRGILSFVSDPECH